VRAKRPLFFSESTVPFHALPVRPPCTASAASKLSPRAAAEIVSYLTVTRWG